jgi:hypothetical protein
LSPGPTLSGPSSPALTLVVSPLAGRLSLCHFCWFCSYFLVCLRSLLSLTTRNIVVWAPFSHRAFTMPCFWHCDG